MSDCKGVPELYGLYQDSFEAYLVEKWRQESEMNERDIAEALGYLRGLYLQGGICNDA